MALKRASTLAVLLCLGRGAFACSGDPKVVSSLPLSVVVVESLDAQGPVLRGTGVVLEGGVVTSLGTAEGASALRVRRGKESSSATLVRKGGGLAFLSLATPIGRPASVRGSAKVEAGERAYALGAAGDGVACTDSLVSNVAPLGASRLLQIPQVVPPAWSGGGLFDAEGRLVGILSYEVRDDENLHLALPAEWATSPPEKEAHLKDEVAWYALGCLRAKEGNYQNAIRAFRKSLDANSSFADGWIRLAFVYDSQHAFEDEVKALKEALKLKPDSAAVRVSLGGALVHLERHDDAIAAYLEAVKAKPDLVEAWQGLGFACDSVKRYPAAIQAFQQVVHLRPGDDAMWLRLGETSIHAGKYPEGIAAFQEVVRLKPDEILAWSSLGLAQAHEEHYKEAIDAFSEVTRRAPQDAEGWLDLARASVKASDRARAKEALKHLRSLDRPKADDFLKENRAFLSP